MQTVTGQDGTLRHPCLYISRRGQFALNNTSEFSVGKEGVNKFKLDEKWNSDSLYSKPGCYVVSNAFSISKNSAAVDILLLKFKVTWSVSCIEASCCDVHESQTWTDLVCYFLQCANGLYLRWLFQTVCSLWMGNLWVSSFEGILDSYPMC
jgi:hypothetical protein